MLIQPLPSHGPWDQGISLDRHTVFSTPIGLNAQGHMQFEILRTDIGEALFQLKHRDNYRQVAFLARSVAAALAGQRFDLVIPMPASRQRPCQPVHEVARQVAVLLGSTYSDQLLLKTWPTALMSDLANYEQRAEALAGCFIVNDTLRHSADVLLLDDLVDTGASLEAACTALRECASIRSISLVALTRRH